MRRRNISYIWPNLRGLIKNRKGLCPVKITARVKANSKHEKVEKMQGDEFVVHVKAPAKEGRANEAVVKVLSEYFGRPKSAVSIVKGRKNKIKVLLIS